MSIVWLEPFVFDPTESNIYSFESLSLMIYLNMISIICFVIYSLLYKNDANMQKPPNTLIIWKMFGECLVSLQFLVLFLCFSFENNKRKIDKTNTIMYFVSLISPLALFITYFFNACIAHNLFITFYTYKNKFDERMSKYKLLALIGGIATLVLSVVFNNNTNVSSVKFTVNYYPFYFTALFYLIGGILMFYMTIRVIFIIKQRQNSMMSYLSQDDQAEAKNDLVSLFVKRHLTFIFSFFLCYLPNNVILLLQIIMSYKICDVCTNYSIFIYLMSLSCTFSFAIKLSEPYMQKYFKVIFKFMFKNEEDTSKKHPILEDDYAKLYNDNKIFDAHGSHDDEHGQLEQNTNSKKENPPMGDIIGNDFRESGRNKKMRHTQSKVELNNIANSTIIVTKEMEAADFFVRMIAMVIALEEDSNYESDPNFTMKMRSYLPWEDNFYTHKSVYKEYTEKYIPDWMKTGETKNLRMKVALRKYAPMVFFHVIKIDKLSIKQILASLDPEKNLKIIKDSFASGGRSSNPIIFTHDKKFLLKTITKEEKNIFIKMLPEYHRRMKDCNSYLCRIYGIFRIRVGVKEDAHIILMRNMNELPSNTRLLVFDLKGSTVDRSVLAAKDKQMIENEKVNDVIVKHKDKILKDNDFTDLKLQFKLSKPDSEVFQQNICSDAEFLRGYNLMDYSLLLSIHAYTEEDEEKSKNNHRVLVSTDKKYIYNFSIIDFLTDYNFFKMSEKLGKNFVNFIKGGNDSNISVQNSFIYARRFVRFLLKNIAQENSSYVESNEGSYN